MILLLRGIWLTRIEIEEVGPKVKELMPDVLVRHYYIHL